MGTIVIILQIVFNIKLSPPAIIAFSLSPLPSERDTTEAAPTPVRRPMAIMKIITGRTMVRPAIAFEPTALPTKRVSTKLYSAIVTIPVIDGIENLNNNDLKFSFKICFFCSSIILPIFQKEFIYLNKIYLIKFRQKFLKIIYAADTKIWHTNF